MYFFKKSIYDVDVWDDVTEAEAEKEFREDMLGHVLAYSELDIADFEIDFNGGCIKPDEFFVKIFK